ncbi:MAG TPA: CoA-binding protein [Vicinamibacterales bacterium]|nr:CoA-binding protein [Vicinamibacterales bacterium]
MVRRSGNGIVVAVIGASNDRRKFGNKAVRAFLARGYTVVPVNTHEREIEGLPAYASVLDIPGRVDRATVYVPPEAGLRVVEEIARKGIREVWLNPGADADEVVTRARALGLQTVTACSIVGIGEDPADY